MIGELTEVANGELRARVARLEAAVHALVELVIQQDVRVRNAVAPDGGLKTLWPFHTTRDTLNYSHVVHPGVGDPHL